MSVTLPAGSTYDPLRARYWFDLLIRDMPSQADRLAVYAAHRAVGDTHFLVSLDMGGLATLPAVVALAREAVLLGGIPNILLMCLGDGQSAPGGGYDPNALGKEWLMAHFAEVYAAFRADHTGDPNNSLAHRTVFIPGFDGVVPAWQPPSSVDAFALMARSVIDAGGAGALGLELSAGYCVWGDETAQEGNNWITPAGKAIDVILLEAPIGMGPPTPCPSPWALVSESEKVRWTQIYQIGRRLISPSQPVPGQVDDLHPPFLLAAGTPRGPFYVDFWEHSTYEWTLPWRRGGSPMPLSLVEARRQALSDMGHEWVG